MSILIQEILGLLKRNKKKTTLERDRDYFEFGKLASTSRINTSSSYIAQMEPFTIKYQDFFCDVRQDLTVTIENSGVEGKIPVYTVKDAICSLDALKDSIITQNSTDTLITITGALTVNEDSILSKNINLGISGDIVNKTSLFNVIHDSAGTAAGAANRILRSLADGRVVWSDDDPVVSLTYGSIWRGSAANVKEELAIGTAGQVLTSDGTTASWSSASVGVTGTGTTKHMAMWTGVGSIVFVLLTLFLILEHEYSVSYNRADSFVLGPWLYDNLILLLIISPVAWLIRWIVSGNKSLKP